MCLGISWSKLLKHGADALSRTLTVKRHLIALLYGQLSGATSLREIVTDMESHETRLYHLGAAPAQTIRSDHGKYSVGSLP
jgi:hypothetical protein